MLGDFSKALPRILVYEGGKVDNPRDPGGRTNKGVTQATFNSYLRSNRMSPEDVYSITDDEVASIYKSRYWDVVSGDKLPPGLDLCVFDAAVNSGPGQAGKWLQNALGTHFSGQVDGLIGSKTLQAVEDFGDVETLINAYCSRRLATLQRNKNWRIFGKGWGARIANVMKTGDAWAADAPAPHPVDVTPLGGHQKANVSDTKPLVVSQITTHVVTASSAGGTMAASAITQLTPVSDSFSWMKYILGGLTIVSVLSGFLVKMASDAKSAAEAGSATATVDLAADSGSIQVFVDDDAVPKPPVSVPQVSTTKAS